MVGNGQQLDCHLVCEAIPIYIQSTHFHVDLYVLPISSANIVLGVQWLKSLGSVLIDYNMLVMKFFYEGNLVTLQGDRDTSISSLSAICRLGQTYRDVLYYHITFLAKDASSSLDLPIAIRELLSKFATLFQPPSTLPPTGDTETETLAEAIEVTEGATTSTAEVQKVEKSKRVVKKPTYLKDFV